MKSAILAFALASVCSAIPCEVPENYIKPLCEGMKGAEILLKNILSQFCHHYAPPAVKEEPCVGGICTATQDMFSPQTPDSTIGEEQVEEIATTMEIPTGTESTAAQEISAAPESSAEESSMAAQVTLQAEPLVLSIEETKTEEIIDTEEIPSERESSHAQEIFVASDSSFEEISTATKGTISLEPHDLPIEETKVGEVTSSEELQTENDSTEVQEVVESSETSSEELSTAFPGTLPLKPVVVPLNTERLTITEAIPTKSNEDQSDISEGKEMFVASTVPSAKSSTIPQASRSNVTKSIAPNNDRPENVRPTTEKEDDELCAQDNQPCIVSEIGKYLVNEAHMKPWDCFTKIMNALLQAPFQESEAMALLTKFFKTVLEGIGGDEDCHKKAS